MTDERTATDLGPSGDLPGALLARWAITDIEEIDRDLFRAPRGGYGTSLTTLYGGQVAAQALAAAGRTVAPDRYPHSLHGYFLRPGSPERPVLFHVDHDRDGGSFSARQVRAVQGGEVIFSMVASFQAEAPGEDFDELRYREVPDPDDLPVTRETGIFEVREVTPTRLEDGLFSDCQWIRLSGPLPDDRLVHACAVTYVSDMGSGFGHFRRPGLHRGGPSVDHAVWFHSPVRADDWLLLDLQPTKVRGERGLYGGTVSDRAGRLGAFLHQEMLLRWGPVDMAGDQPTVVSEP